VPLSEPARDITLMPGGTARVALRQLAPKPYSIERVETLATLERFLKTTGDAEIAWLSDGVDTGRGTEFTEALGRPSAIASLRSTKAARPRRWRWWPLKTRGQDDGESIAHQQRHAAGVVRAIDAKGSPIGEARYAFGLQDRESEAAFDLPVELRNDISRLEIAGERSAALYNCSTSAAPPRHRCRDGLQPAIRHSRYWLRPSISPARCRPSPTCG